MSTATDEKEARYSGFSKPQSVGILGMPVAASIVLILNLAVVSQLVGIVPGWWQLALWGQFGVLLFLCLVKNADGITQWERLSRRLKFNLYAFGGLTVYKPSFLSGKPPVSVLSDVQVLEYGLGGDRKFALLYFPISQQYAAPLICQPTGGERLDVRDRNQRTTDWGGFSSALSRINGAAQSVTCIEVAPRTQYEALRRMEDYISDKAPQDAQDVTRERMNIGRDNHVGPVSWETVTFNSIVKGSSKKAHRTNAEHIAGVLPGIMERLSASGAGRVTPATERDIAEYQRMMVDPQSRPLIEEARADGDDTGVTWANCGPMHLNPSHDYLIHDQAVSATLVMVDPPGDAIPDTILAPLIAPHPDIEIKRFALIKQVINPGLSRTLTRRDLNNATTRHKLNPVADPEQREVRVAARTADETLSGHTLEDFTIVITVTVTDPARLQRAIQAVITQLGPAAGVRFRLATDAQETAFFYGGPFGLDLHQHSVVEVSQRAASTNNH